MDEFRIRGGRSLEGEVRLSGSKNATLPLLCLSLLTEEPVVLEGLPRVRDIDSMIQLLNELGVEVVRDVTRASVKLHAKHLKSVEANYDLVRKMRASILVLGPLLARSKKAIVSQPGGCAIGARPVDRHIHALEAMGATFELHGGYIHGSVDRLRGSRIAFSGVTVTGTINAVIAAARAEGASLIEGAALEPEVVEVCTVLNQMGAKIRGIGTATLEIEGVSGLRGVTHRVSRDRIECGTYMVASAITGGKLFIPEAPIDQLGQLMHVMRVAGATIETSSNGVTVSTRGRPQAVHFETQPYPGFPTDMQAQMMAWLTLAAGESRIVETIFENRFMHVSELNRLGAAIQIHGREAVIAGVPHLEGASVMATDLRASASLVLAGLAASGETRVLRVYHIDRGYERIDEKLRTVGADIERVSQ